MSITTVEVDRTGPADWKVQEEFGFEEIIYEKADEGIAKITINRPEKRNAFTPLTVDEMKRAFDDARDDGGIGVVLLTGQGEKAFCSGGDQSVRGTGGYVGTDKIPRLNVLDLQRQIRTLPKPVIAMVAGYAVGGGHILHMICDLTIAADNAIFGQTGPKVGSFDGGYGSSHMARIVGQKKAREIWFLCRQYTADEALEMGLVNAVVPLREDGGGVGAVGPGDPPEQPHGHPPDQGRHERRRGRAGRAPAARWRRHSPLLSHRGGTGRQERVPGEAEARVQQVPALSLTKSAA